MKFFICAIAMFSLVQSQGLMANEEVYKSLERDLKTFTKVLTRKVRLYHWGDYSNRTTRNLKSTDRYWQEQIFTSQMTGFFAHERNSDMMGPGFYAAYDPHVSDGYGNTLLEIEVDEGVRFLDIRQGGGSDLELSDETVKGLQSMCRTVWPIVERGAYNYQGRTYYGIWLQDIVHDKPCHRLFNRAYKSLGIQFIAYTWLKDGDLPIFSYEPCNRKSYDGYVVTGQLTVDDPEFRNFRVDTSKMKVGGFIREKELPKMSPTQLEQALKTDEDLQAHLFIHKFHQIAGNLNYGPWEIFNQSFNYSQSGVMEKISSTRFGCNPEKFQEDAIIKL